MNKQKTTVRFKFIERVTALRERIKARTGTNFDISALMDIFLTHVTTLDSVDIFHKFTCIGLKTGLGTENDLNQIMKYENWLIRKLTAGDNDMIQSMLIAFDFQDKALEHVQRRKQIEGKVVRLIISSFGKPE